jgi:fatty acid desaturase
VAAGEEVQMPTRRALVAAAIPAIAVAGIFWAWLGFPAPLAGGLGLVFGIASVLVTRSVYDQSGEELEAWRRAAPDLAELDSGRAAPRGTPAEPDAVAEPAARMMEAGQRE